jgi:branched-chain amino acid transport system substrate-binding protein
MNLIGLFLRVCCSTALLVSVLTTAGSSQTLSGSDNTVKIGLLIPDNNSTAAKYGAELAVRIANEKGGFNGRHFRLVVRSMEGPWGTGSKEAVNLVFDENVCALIGSCDGRNAHLVEQVTTKARIVFLSAWAADPTLAQAFVPWYFSCVPTNIQQADALIEEIYNKRKIIKIAAVSDNDFDSKLAMESFLKRVKLTGKADPGQLFYDNKTEDFNDLINQIKRISVSSIILFGKPQASIRLINQLKEKKMNQQVFGSLSLLDEDEITAPDMKYYENVVTVSSGNYSGSEGSGFREEYHKNYGKIPGAVAAFSFDAMNLIIEAIRKAGTDRENIQKALAKIHFTGVTGSIQFDDKGKRIGVPGLVEIKNGVPVRVER